MGGGGFREGVDRGSRECAQMGGVLQYTNSEGVMYSEGNVLPRSEEAQHRQATLQLVWAPDY